MGDFDIDSAVGEVYNSLTEGVVEEVQEPTREEAPPVTPEAPVEPELEEPTEETPVEQAITAPKTWRKEAAALFASLPETVRAEIEKRETDIFKGLEQYKESAKLATRFSETIAPFAETFKTHGVDPLDMVAPLLSAHMTLISQSPQERLAAFSEMAASYGINLEDVLDMQTGVDPAVVSLQKKIQGLESQLAGLTTAQQTAKQAEAATAVEKFASDPANPYFDELSNDIARLLKVGEAKDLREAYDKALWMNPTVRAKELLRQQQEQEEAAKKATAEKVEKARKSTAANVATKAKSGSAATPLGSIDDTLASTLAEIKARG